MRLKLKIAQLLKIVLLSCLTISSHSSLAGDLDEVQAAGVLRHIGIPYGNFVTLYPVDGELTAGGLDVELIQGFADYLGVEYQFVKSEVGQAFGLLTGQDAKYINRKVVYGDKVSIQGDLLADGITVLDWRKKVVNFSDDYFPACIWLFARTDSTLQPIQPSGSMLADIEQVKSQLNGHQVLARRESSIDPDLYNLEKTGAEIILQNQGQKLEDIILSLLDGSAESTLMDVIDGLAALDRWAGRIKAIGPISEQQRIAVLFPKSSPKLLAAFNLYLQQIRANGTYHNIVKKYYPEIFNFYPAYFTTAPL